MKGGTYSEALKVGFTEKQAGFLSRLGGETRQEAIEDVINHLKVKQKCETARGAAKFLDAFIILVTALILVTAQVSFAIGLALGMVN